MYFNNVPPNGRHKSIAIDAFKITFAICLICRWERFNNTYLERILLRDYEEHQRQNRLLEVSVRLQADEAVNYIQTHGTLPNSVSMTSLQGYNNDGL